VSPGPPESRLRIFRGATLVTMDGADSVVTGDLVVRDGRIVSAGAPTRGGGTDGAEIVDLSGRWIIPGLIQGHVHLGQTLFRGLAEDRRLLRWLEERIWPMEAAHTETSAYYSGLIGGLEAIRGGTTTLLDIGLVRGMAGLFRALTGLGVRAWTGKLLMDRGDGAPEALLEEPARAIAESRELAREWDGSSGGRIRYAVCPRFVYSCSGEMWENAVEQCREGGFMLHTHALETREEQAAVRVLENRSELDTLEAVGALSVPLRVAHGVWVDAPDADRLAAAGPSVIHCPASNLKLGSGVADVKGLLARGVAVGLGTDGSPCNNFLDPYGEMRLAALLQKWKHGPEAFTAKDALERATRGGAAALGASEDIGSLEPGKRADFVVLNLDDHVHSLMADEVDPWTRVVFGADRTNIESVHVDGHAVYERGLYPGVDVRETMARAREELASLLKRVGR
jgi:5-methylthioadenosine/S-adenosylhomocysteine deaminase